MPRAFEQRGIQPGEVVILILQHGADLVHAFFGAVLHGSIPAIMPFLTEKLLPERYRADLTALVGITRPAAIVTYPEFEPEVQAALSGGSSVRAVLVSDQIGEPCEPDFAALGGMHRSPQDIVLLQHSSGTTGLQKGVALSHQAVFNQLESYSLALRLQPDDVLVSWLPLYHDMGLIAGFLMPILLGIPLVIMSPFEWVRAPLQTAAGRLALQGHPVLAAQFCLQLLRPEDPRARPGGSGPVFLAGDQQLLRADALCQPPGFPRTLCPLRAAPRGAGHLLRHGRERLCRHPGRDRRAGDGRRDRPGWSSD